MNLNLKYFKSNNYSTRLLLPDVINMLIGSLVLLMVIE